MPQVPSKRHLPPQHCLGVSQGPKALQHTFVAPGTPSQVSLGPQHFVASVQASPLATQHAGMITAAPGTTGEVPAALLHAQLVRQGRGPEAPHRASMVDWPAGVISRACGSAERPSPAAYAATR